MNEFGWVSIIGFCALFSLTLLLYKGYKERPFLKYIPSLFIFVLSFCGILAGIFWTKGIEDNQLSFLSTAISLSCLMNIVASVFLDLLTAQNKI
ncbi:drug/metabolite transporter (DMT)-like permease [Bacillus fengqiuensis]|nr:drug/metabolite transporter (DMT)-like permease [Bacillus fengqiuensis]